MEIFHNIVRKGNYDYFLHVFVCARLFWILAYVLYCSVVAIFSENEMSSSEKFHWCYSKGLWLRFGERKKILKLRDCYEMSSPVSAIRPTQVSVF